MGKNYRGLYGQFQVRQDNFKLESLTMILKFAVLFNMLKASPNLFYFKNLYILKIIRQLMELVFRLIVNGVQIGVP